MNYHVEEATIERFTRELIETPSPVSYYEEIHPLMERIARQIGYTITYDRKRTAYIRVEGEDTSKTVCVGAHLDTIGLMIRHINDNGPLLCVIWAVSITTISKAAACRCIRVGERPIPDCLPVPHIPRMYSMMQEVQCVRKAI